MGFFINQNYDSQDLEDLLAVRPLCYKWFLLIATSSLEVLNRMIMEWIIQLKANQIVEYSPDKIIRKKTYVVRPGLPVSSVCTTYS